MSVKEMTKEEYIEFRVSKGMDKELVLEKIAKFEEQARDFGMVENEILDYVKKRFTASLTKKNRSPRDTFYGVIVTQNMTDFGAQKAYDQAKEAYDQDPEGAINLGIVDSDGDPIWNTPQAEWKHKTKIIPKNELRNNLTGIALTEKLFNENSTKSEEQKESYKKLNLTLQRESLKREIPMFALIKFEAGIKGKSTNSEYFLFGNEDTKFEIIKEFSAKELDAFINEYYSDKIVTIDKLSEFAFEQQNDFNAVAFIKAGLTDIVLTNEDKMSNILVINDMYDESILPITCWVPKNIDCKFSTNADEVLVVGRVTEGEQININVKGLWIDPRFKVDPNMQNAEKMLNPETENKVV